MCGLLGAPDDRPEFKAFPYTAPSVLKTSKKVTFNDSSELKDYLLRVYREAIEFNNGEMSGAILDTYSQMPFFCNINIFLDTKFQSDLRRYIYVQDTGTPPYDGGYGSTPKIWVDKYFIIKGIVNEYQNREMKKRGRKAKTSN